MGDPRDKHREAYREEACELLVELEFSLLDLEQSPKDEELTGRVFRALHTIKGSGAMFGFDDIADFAHEVENVFELVRDGEIAVTGDLVNLTLSARDLLREMLDTDCGIPDSGSEIIRAFRKFVPDTLKTESAVAPEAGDSATGFQKAVFRVRFKPPADIFESGTDPSLLLRELGELGHCHLVAMTGEIPPLDEMVPDACYTHWEALVVTEAGFNAVKDVFIFVENESDLSIDVIPGLGEIRDDAGFEGLGKALVERGDLSAEDLGRFVRGQRTESGRNAEAPPAPPRVGRQPKTRQNARTESSVRVATDKLDALVNLVGEMVVVQARLSRKASNQNDPELRAISEEVERMTRGVRDNAMSMRMLPVGTVFNTFTRLVRDLSRELGKKVEMTTEGGDTEIDKTIIDRLNDPLVHIIRNCIDHGIESPEARRNAGKPAQGVIRLSAKQAGGRVVIRIADDGAGLDAREIRKKAEEKGLLPKDGDPDEKALFSLVFVPGFSTSTKVSEVSGRGVGMDVVKRHVESLHGLVEIDSQSGSGTTVTLRLPLTLAIMDGLLVEIGPGNYVLPLPSVEECVEMSRAEAASARERGMMDLRGQTVSYVDLREKLFMGENRPDMEHVVVSVSNEGKIGFGVDRVVGHFQVVSKPLSNIYKNIKDVSGTTILGDGSVALVLDVDRLAGV